MIKIVPKILFNILGFLIIFGYIQSIELSKIIGDSTSIYNIFISSLPLIRRKRLTQKEKAAFTISNDLKEILVGLLLGDLHGRYRYGKTSFIFKQGFIHQEYIYHLYDLFIKYCPRAPKLSKSLPDFRTGKIYNSISFFTYTLPCFNELYNLFYKSGKKVIPNNIEELLKPIGLAYWIADDGSWNKVNRYVSLSTESFKLEEVELLIKVLNKNFNLSCYKSKNGTTYKIIIPSYSISVLQNFLLPHMPKMMLYKIRL